jgi:hypothetical protein
VTHPTDAEKLSRVLELAFGSDRLKFDEFCGLIKEAVPEAHAAVLRGSAITGQRHVDGAPFDADGAGTSDLDLTLVGADVLRYYSAFWIPGMHSKPLSDDDPDIAPELTPLRRRLMDLVGRPVNIQGTRDWVQHFRGDIMNQPYLILFGEIQEP